MNVVVFGTRHRIARWEDDWRLCQTVCELRVFYDPGACPDTDEHLTALPTCPHHSQTITRCERCFEEKP